MVVTRRPQKGTAPHKECAARSPPERRFDFRRSRFLFVQAFANGTWTPKAGAAGTYTLALTGPVANTIAFSDRPQRIVEMMPTQQFLDNPGFTLENLPNAALVTGSGEQHDVLVIELSNPLYDGTTLTYDAMVLAECGEAGLAHLARQQAGFDFPATFADGSLFIDDGGCPGDPGECYNIVNGNVNIIGDMPIETCSGNGMCVSIPCNDDGTSSHYRKICARLYPDQCSYTVSANEAEWDCFGRGDDI
jgi:hypothetical protein